MGDTQQASQVQRTRCCIVGAGPGGAVLALLLARAGVPVTLLEAHDDFEREFRGDSIHPGTMELMEQLGLADRLLELPHTTISQLVVGSDSQSVTVADLRRLKTRYPFITLLPQARFLEVVTAEAQREPSFRLVMGAHVQELIEEGGVVRGVRYRAHGGWHEVRALLVVGADGRSSMVRRLAGMQPRTTSPPMDVLWFRLPRRPDDPEQGLGRFTGGQIFGMLNREEYWQVAYVFPKGHYQQLRAAGLDAFRRSVGAGLPLLADRVEHLQDWRQISLLSVESSRLDRWYRPGLLLIGDAAHVMSPVGGVGINYAIQDAVVAADVLREPLQSGRMRLRDLHEVQRRREWPTRVIQAFQALVQRRMVQAGLDPDTPFTVPRGFRTLLRVPVLRDLPARLIAFGVRRP
ncbi:MAG: FAD-dependent oxidoreductase [Egibacteraceae bacterium]